MKKTYLEGGKICTSHGVKGLLKVEHLCQYFGPTKAVDDVSFEIKKGEIFGLVGESGCGKTTTGRSIIKLYDITSGNVYFKGQRIGAGTRSYKDAITAARTEASKKIKALRAEKTLKLNVVDVAVAGNAYHNALAVGLINERFYKLRALKTHERRNHSIFFEGSFLSDQ